ncbi:MAG: hypothetical protein QXX64_03955 [Nitrososphaera sp.]|uniref:DUF4760 domain-containing protein n=1 Tax=Nitrososphaera gargensis (strain Ga9.2) TaxID=1237085 RepID=K0IJQ3_NITGG|nr:hypothetical protein [Candidatus Nitrososphaera gargensis]AFU60300.1 hypothetical protein Ngar_c33850 [Candidatus Nitrososphaera gargensis Ga9.2]
MVEEVPLTAIAVIVGTATAVISAFTIYYRKKQYEIMAKQYNLNALLEVFQLLNNETHRKARQAVYRYHRSRLDGKNPDEEEVGQEIAMVRSDFDMIGTFIRNELISKEVFLDAYWDTTLICWDALKDNIAKERELRQNQHYMANFEHLAYEARQYKEKYMPRESVEPY